MTSKAPTMLEGLVGAQVNGMGIWVHYTLLHEDCIGILAPGEAAATRKDSSN